MRASLFTSGPLGYCAAVRDRFVRFAWLVLGFNLAVILWGAYVRASGSGAGCGSHWPLCNGVVVPRAPTTATLIELTHRVTSGLALLLVVGLFAWARQARPPGHPARTGAGFALGFMVGEALLGAGLVLLALVATDASVRRVIALALHLLNTFLLVASLGVTAYLAGQRPAPGGPGGPGRPGGRGWTTPWLLVPVLVGTLLIGVTGAMTALGDTLFPARDLAAGLAQDQAPTAHFLLRLRVIHPALALLTSLYLAVAVGVLATQPVASAVRRLARLALLLFVLQVGAGLTNLLLLAPVYMQLLHLLLADCVWLALVLLTVAYGQAVGPVPARRV